MVYRERKRIRLTWLSGLAIIIVAAAALGGIWLAIRSSSASVDPRVEARAKALEAAQGLEVFAIEYPQAAQGTELSGALGALARAQTTFESARGQLAQIDATAVEQIADGFSVLKAKADERAPAAQALELADDLREKLLALAKP